MIITKTPLRISFAGGGTDFPEFHHREFGCVVSIAIDKFMYIMLNEKFAGDIRAGYNNMPGEIQHPIAREALKFLGVEGIEITSNADVPAGTGLGSSGSFAVGLLNALHSYKKETPLAQRLAEDAGYVERVLAHELSGKQDHYIAAYGGLCYIQFNQDDSVLVEAINYPHLLELNKNLMLVYVGPRVEDATFILEEETKNLKVDEMREIKALAIELKKALVAGSPPTVVGQLLDESWRLKRALASGISTPLIDDYYSRALQGGATGGKLLGAGGGGFMLLYCPREKQEAVRKALGLRVMPFMFEKEGSHVIYNDTTVHRQP